MSYTFLYVDPNGVDVTMEVPERPIDEMCDYFQRFLVASGYVFDEGERIDLVKTSSNSGHQVSSVSSGDSLVFKTGQDHFPINPDAYDPIWGSNIPSWNAGGAVVIPGAHGEDIIDFSGDTINFG